MALDPICGMQVEEREGAQSAEYAGETHYFCSSDCLERFDSQPDLFTGGRGEGQMADHDRGIHPAENPGCGAHAALEQPPVDAGPG